MPAQRGTDVADRPARPRLQDHCRLPPRQRQGHSQRLPPLRDAMPRVEAIGGRPTRPLFGYSGSITAISRAHGTMRSISARNFSRRVRFFFIAYSALAKLRWLIVLAVLAGALSSTRRRLVATTARRINQHLPSLVFLPKRVEEVLVPWRYEVGAAPRGCPRTLLPRSTAKTRHTHPARPAAMVLS